eukprot:6225961-Prymnesium_polylepis.1
MAGERSSSTTGPKAPSLVDQVVKPMPYIVMSRRLLLRRHGARRGPPPRSPLSLSSPPCYRRRWGCERRPRCRERAC